MNSVIALSAVVAAVCDRRWPPLMRPTVIDRRYSQAAATTVLFKTL